MGRGAGVQQGSITLLTYCTVCIQDTEQHFFFFLFGFSIGRGNKKSTSGFIHCSVCASVTALYASSLVIWNVFVYLSPEVLDVTA